MIATPEWEAWLARTNPRYLAQLRQMSATYVDAVVTHNILNGKAHLRRKAVARRSELEDELRILRAEATARGVDTSRWRTYLARDAPLTFGAHIANGAVEDIPPRPAKRKRRPPPPAPPRNGRALDGGQLLDRVLAELDGRLNGRANGSSTGHRNGNGSHSH